MSVNWKERHDKLAELTHEFLVKQQELEMIGYKVRLFVDESDRLSLDERNLVRYCRLKEDVEITVRWESNNWPDPDKRQYKAGTLVEGRMPAKVFRGAVVTVYLDDDGDGFLDFPAEKMEVVELSWDELEGKTIVNQG
jgi:hypothetical protein